jgi:Lon protease-like protein
VSEPAELAAVDLSSLPVFPLPGLVLFPHTTLPLHLFEPRYRALITDCLAGSAQRIVIAQLEPGWRGEYEGRPPIHATAGLGRVRRHRKNADGTFDVLLEGEARVFVEAEEPVVAGGPPYRRASVRLLPERPGRLQADDLTVAWALAREIATQVTDEAEGFQLATSPDDPPGLFVDRLADQLIADPAARQDLLETLDVGQRAQVLVRRLGALRDQLSRRPGHTPTLH